METTQDKDDQPEPKPQPEQDAEPNWKRKCEVCGQRPTVGELGLCGPCCFGDASTVGGNW